MEEKTVMNKLRDDKAEELLKRLNDTENYPEETLAPYEQFTAGGEIYYFTPGGFLYRRDAVTEEIGGFFCGYLTDKVWRYRTSARQARREAA